MARGLGVVLTPYGKLPNGAAPYAIDYDRTPGQTLCPQDPQFYSRDETGYYYDTHLGAVGCGGTSLWQRIKDKLSGRTSKAMGAIPTDFELARVRGYLPVESGWVRTTTGYATGPWLPPGGVAPGIPQTFQTPMAPLNGLRGLGLPDPSPPATVEDVMATMAAHNDRVFALALVSTSAVAVSALLGLFRTLKLIKAGE